MKLKDETMSDDEGTGKHYSKKGFWAKLADQAKIIGRPIVHNALLLYYALENPKLPAWAHTTIYGALGYLIFPLDVIPDFMPPIPIGYTDDAGVLAAAVAAVAAYVDKAVRKKAKDKLSDWFDPV